MHFQLLTDPPTKVQGECLALAVFDRDLAGKGNAALDAVDRALKGVLLRAARQEGFKGKADQSFALHAQGKLKAERVMLVGLGPQAAFNAETLRMAAGRVAKACQRGRVTQATFALPSTPDLATSARAAVEGFALGDYRFDRYRTDGNGDSGGKRHLRTVRLLLPTGQSKSKPLSSAVQLGQKVAEATNWARDLVNEPAGMLTPSRLAEEAQKAAEAHGLQVSVGGLDEIRELRMGMFLGVAQGSALEPKLVHVWYAPESRAQATRAPVALVGKAITFDSGGLSLKSAEGMMDMKTDMAGSAAVLGAMQVVGALKPPFPVHAFLGACENMPSGTAYRPGDILISRLGKTVEITNTDAEGRLVLGDILAWAAELKPAALIDIATLTGACIVALGHYITGVFGDDEGLVGEVLESGRAAGEELWRLPLFGLQKESLKSDVADMKNAGERWGGAINAAVFLKEFTRGVPWVHLDIAGPSQSPKERGYYGKGATGGGVRTLVELIRRRAEAVGKDSA